MSPRAAISLTIGLLCSLPSVADAWSGSVTLYDNTKFTGGDYLFHVNETQTCYNVGACFDNRVSSIKWADLPTQGSFNGDAWIFFYENADCNRNTVGDWFAGPRGKVRGWKVREPFQPEDLGFDGFDKMISSFMVWESTGTVARYRSACWEDGN